MQQVVVRLARPVVGALGLLVFCVMVLRAQVLVPIVDEPVLSLGAYAPELVITDEGRFDVWQVTKTVSLNFDEVWVDFYPDFLVATTYSQATGSLYWGELSGLGARENSICLSQGWMGVQKSTTPSGRVIFKLDFDPNDPSQVQHCQKLTLEAILEGYDGFPTFLRVRYEVDFSHLVTPTQPESPVYTVYVAPISGE